VGNAYARVQPTLPRHWVQALEAFRNARVLPDYLGERFCHVFAAIKEAELDSFQRHVCGLEYDWYWRGI
jgi:glutamine synthetase